jgi:hypothetical protein
LIKIYLTNIPLHIVQDILYNDSIAVAEFDSCITSFIDSKSTLIEYADDDKPSVFLDYLLPEDITEERLDKLLLLM